MSESKGKKIQPVISDETYGTLLYIRAEERTTIQDIVEKAIKEYAAAHCPAALK